MMSGKMQLSLKVCLLAVSMSMTSMCEAFSPISSTSSLAVRRIPTSISTNHVRAQGKAQEDGEVVVPDVSGREKMQMSVAALSLAGMISMSVAAPLNVNAYDDFDSDIDTVDITVQALKDATGDTAATFKVFESISEIITEGKGVGGSLSAKGVNLERGYVADEDTTIYNPGLSLLTESEKNRILDAVIQNRKESVTVKAWSQDNEYAFDFLKTKLDPLHMVELKGYLGILPFYGAAVYLLALGVQQFARDIFSTAYVVSALAVFLPIFALILKGT